MKAVIQRVSGASVAIAGQVSGEIGEGLLLLLGIEPADGQEDIDWLCRKIANLRIFGDGEGKMNRSVMDVGGDVLVVSQFTLHASIKKGNRPSYTGAAPPDVAIPLYNGFVEHLRQLTGMAVPTGRFGASMQVALVNDGPVTIIIDTKNKV